MGPNPALSLHPYLRPSGAWMYALAERLFRQKEREKSQNSLTRAKGKDFRPLKLMSRALISGIVPPWLDLQLISHLAGWLWHLIVSSESAHWGHN